MEGHLAIRVTRYADGTHEAFAIEYPGISVRGATAKEAIDTLLNEIILYEEQEDGTFVACKPSHPGVEGRGATEDDAVDALRVAIEARP